MLRSLVSCGRCSTLSHPNMFQNVSKAILCDRRNTFAPFSEDELAFCVAGAAFQARRVACFFQIELSGLRQVVTTCKLRGRCDIL